MALGLMGILIAVVACGSRTHTTALPSPSKPSTTPPTVIPTGHVLEDGTYWGDISAVDATNHIVTFIPKCHAAGTSGPTPINANSSQQVRLVIGPGTTLSLYYRPNGDPAQGHIQQTDLAGIAGAAAGGMPDFPPGWIVLVRDGATVDFREESGIGGDPAQNLSCTG